MYFLQVIIVKAGVSTTASEGGWNIFSGAAGLGP